MGDSESSLRIALRRPFGAALIFLPVVVTVALTVVLSHSIARAETIKFPDDELSSESVLPVVDNSVAVKNKNVVNRSRFELGAIGSLSLLEPFFNPYSYGVSVGYHITDEHAINLTGIFFLQGLSNNANSLNPIPGTQTTTNPAGQSMNLQYAPEPQYLLLAEYQFTGLYGKISLSKNYVMNLSLYGLAGLGAYGIGSSMIPAVDIGIGQKLYFTPNFALRTDVRMIAYQGPDVLSTSLQNATSAQPASAFSTSTIYVSLLSVGLIFMFPGM